MTVDDLTSAMGKPVLRLPAWGLLAALAVATPLACPNTGPNRFGFCNIAPCWPMTA